MSAYRPLTSVDTVVIHCTATANGRRVRPEAIDHWHAQRGFSRAQSLIDRFQHAPSLRAIGYHWLIGHRGEVYSGRHPEETGAHAVDARWPSGDKRRRVYNDRGLAIAMTGMDAFSRAQWCSLDRLVRGILRDLGKARDIVFASPWDDYGRVPPAEVARACERLGVTIAGHRDLPGVTPRGCPCFSVEAWLTGQLRPLDAHIFDGPLDD